MSVKFDELVDTVSIKNDVLKIKVVVVGGKEGDHYVFVAPSVNVSGYAETEEEAKIAFTENLNTFCEDFMAHSGDEREQYLISLGFQKQKFSSRNFSKAYIDEQGALQGLEQSTLNITTLETAC